MIKSCTEYIRTKNSPLWGPGKVEVILSWVLEHHYPLSKWSFEEAKIFQDREDSTYMEMIYVYVYLEGWKGTSGERCSPKSYGEKSAPFPFDTQCTVLVVGVCAVAQPCLTLWAPLDHSPPSSSIHEMFHVRILEWVAISFSRSSQLRDWLNSGLQHCRWILYWLSYQGSLIFIS